MAPLYFLKLAESSLPTNERLDALTPEEGTPTLEQTKNIICEACDGVAWKWLY
jgi:hypothetical protein